MAAQKSAQLKALLKKADAPVKNYVSALEAENAKRQRKIAKLEVNQVSLNNRVKALEKELKKHSGPLDLETALGEFPRLARARQRIQEQD